MALELIERSAWAGVIDLERGWRRATQAAVPLVPKGIVIHHTEESEVFNQCDHVWCVARLRHWHIVHTQERQWSDIGYHLLICPHGVVFEGRLGGLENPIQGAHAVGNNDRALGIAMLGNYQRSLPTYGAWSALKRVVAHACKLYRLQPNQAMLWNYLNPPKSHEIQAPTVVGHRDVRATICPGERLYGALGELRTELNDG